MIVDIKYYLFIQNICSVDVKKVKPIDLQEGVTYTIDQYRSRSIFSAGKWRKTQKSLSSVDFKLNKDGTIPKRITVEGFEDTITEINWKLFEFYEILFNDHGIKYVIDRVENTLKATGDIQDFLIIAGVFEPKTHHSFLYPIKLKIEGIY